MNQEYRATFFTGVAGLLAGGRAANAAKAALAGFFELFLLSSIGLSIVGLSMSSSAWAAAQSPARPSVAPPSAMTALSFSDARHFLNRTGIGSHPSRLNRYIGLSREAAVDLLIEEFSSTPSQPMPQWVSRTAPRYASLGEMSPDLRREFKRTRDREITELRQWWVREMLETGSPQSERLVLFWHNHFVSGYSAIDEQSSSIARQNILFRENALGNYRDFLKRVIRDPAMLNYLDNDNNRRNAPNENLARELMELFTLGEGHYTEDDVKNAARALTGYGVAQFHNMQFRFYWNKHDFGEKKLFGQSGKFNGDDLVDVILQQARAAEYLTERFWQTFVAAIPDQKVDRQAAEQQELEKIASLFRDSGYEITTLYRAILLSDAFWSPHNRAGIIKSPVDMVVGTLRTTGKSSRNWQVLPSVLSRLGQNLFEAPNVAGWPGGAAWVSPDRLLARMDWLQQFAESGAMGKATTDDAMAGAAMASEAMEGGAMEGGAMAAGSVATMNLSGVDGEGLSNGVGQDAVTASLRIAGEAFRGAPLMQLSLLLDGQSVWSSNEIAVRGAHDTERFGRVEGMDNMPWLVETVYVTDSLAELPEYDALMIRFLNDAADGSGDRNLYVDWIKLGSETHYASNGKQISDCVPKVEDRAGLLYCEGTLTIERKFAASQLKAESTTDQHQADSLTILVGETQLRWVKDPKRVRYGHADIAFALLDVEFQDRQFNTLMLRYAQTPSGTANDQSDYALWLDNYGCWPDCFEQWPDCARSAKPDRSFREVSISLPAKNQNSATPGPSQSGSGQCQLNDFLPVDRQLISALWQLAPRLYEQAHDSVRVRRRPKWAAAFANWQEPIDQLAHQVSMLGANSVDIAQPVALQVTGRNVDRTLVMDPRTLSSEPVIVAGRTASQLEDDVSELMREHDGELALSDLLLSTAPVVASASDARLLPIVSDPVYQLK